MKKTTLCATGLMLVLVLSLGGCPDLGLGGTGGTSLAGTWKVTGANGATLPTTILLTFNSANRVTNISVDPGGINMAPPIAVVAKVNGDQVSFTANFPLGLGSVSMDGTLNAAGDVIAGTISINTSIAGVPPQTTEQGQLVKQ